MLSGLGLYLTESALHIITAGSDLDDLDGNLDDLSVDDMSDV